MQCHATGVFRAGNRSRNAFGRSQKLSVSIAIENARVHFERDSFDSFVIALPRRDNLDERVGDLHGLKDQSVARFHVLAVMADWWRVAPINFSLDRGRPI